MSETNRIIFSQISEDEISSYGILCRNYSQYSIKAILDGKIVGFIVFDERPLDIKVCKGDSEKIIKYKEMLNSHPSVYLRSIRFDKELRYTGMLEDMFDYAVRRLPPFALVWCYPNVWDVNNYIMQIGGFAPPMYNLHRRFLLYSLN